MKLSNWVEKTMKHEEISGFKCDICGKTHEGKSMPLEWITVRQYWADEWEVLHDLSDDVCSWNCYIKLLTEWYEENKENSDEENTIDDKSVYFLKTMLK